jgi:nitroreductase
MLTPDQLTSILRWRYAAKSFDSSKVIPEPEWSALENALILTASSYGLQPWKFLVVRNSLVKEQLRAASWNQRQVTECSHYVIFAKRMTMDENYVDHYLSTISTVRGVGIDTLGGFRKGILGDVVTGPRSQVIPEWTARQCYIALGNFMTAAATIGVDTCPMEGLNPERYDEILGLKDTEYRTVVACAAGYRNPDDLLGKAKKVRFGREALIQDF